MEQAEQLSIFDFIDEEQQQFEQIESNITNGLQQLKEIKNETQSIEDQADNRADTLRGNNEGDTTRIESTEEIIPIQPDNLGSLGGEPRGEAEGVGARTTNLQNDIVNPTIDRVENFGSEPRPNNERNNTDRDIDGAGREPRSYPVKDFRISEELKIGGQKDKFNKNIEALKILKSDKDVSEDDQKTLALYSGWGGLPQVFDENNEDWLNERNKLKEVLNEAEFTSARSSTQDSFYTPKELSSFMWNGLERMGIKTFEDQTKSILEPSAGVGAFMSYAPEDLNAKFVGIELDTISADILKILQPNQRVQNRGFETLDVAPMYDAVISNPPFGSKKIYDPLNDDLTNLSIHNYFMAKSIDSLKEDGIAAFVVSAHFMDGNDSATREYISEKASFLGGVRIPNDAFKNSGTEVTTDILFFKKGKDHSIDNEWVNKETLSNEHGYFEVNEYFSKNSHNILGDFKLQTGAYQESQQCVADGRDLSIAFNDFIKTLPENIYRHSKFIEEEKILGVDIDENHEQNNHPVFSVGENGVFKDLEDNICLRVNDQFTDKLTARYKPLNDLTELEKDRLGNYIKIRDQLNHLIELEKKSETPIDTLNKHRLELNKTYDKFVEVHGFLNRDVNKRLFRTDLQCQKILALEKNYSVGISKAVAKKNEVDPIEPSAEKADIFNKRVINPYIQPSVNTPKEALIASMNKYGEVNLNYMGNLFDINRSLSASLSQEEIVESLINDDLIYKDHKSDKYVLADQYLSGNVLLKLKEVQKLSESNPELLKNLSALEKIQPEFIEAVDIAVDMGASWIPSSYYQEFLSKQLNVETKVDYLDLSGAWVVEFNKHSLTTLVSNEYGTDRCDVAKVIDCIMSNKPVRVYDSIPNPTEKNPDGVMRVLNVDETASASSKATLLKNEFKDWIWENQERREVLANIYNERFNTHVPPKYDGSHLTLEGMNTSITLRKHQKDAIWRGVQEGTALYDHVVGAGKTMVCIATIMESKRMGLMDKPLVIVPNHLSTQWKNDFYHTYPDANILVAEKSDLKKDNRERFFGKIATGSFDAIIMTHSQFRLISAPQSELEAQINENIDSLRQTLSFKQNSDKDYSVKDLEKQLSTYEKQLKELSNTDVKSKAMDFSDFGIDALFVDEAHEFKNLNIVTSMGSVAGLGNLKGSQMAFDLYCKTRFIQKNNDGRGVFFATGTPISNTISELYTMQRYLQYEDLKDKGIHNFDAWAKTFGEVGHNWELDSSGVNYKIVSRFNKFQNVPELINMYQGFADVIANKDIEKYSKNLIPKAYEGKPLNVVVDRTERVAHFIGFQDNDGMYNEGSIIWRMDNFRENPRYNNVLACTMDARKVGLDYRLIDNDAPDEANTKINTAVENIFSEYQNWNEEKGVQLVFCDLATPKKHSQKAEEIQEFQVEPQDGEVEEVKSKKQTNDDVIEINVDEAEAKNQMFDIYTDILKKLVDKGVPQDQIRFIHDANTDLKKQKLFQDTRDGNVRVLLGSTSRMGAGTNVQNKLVAIHHIDCPWRPSDLEQRNGRIYRQGNEFHKADPEGFRIKEFRYATKQTYDARMWQTIESKATAIEQFRKGSALRVVEDVLSDSANAADMKAAATGNPLILKQVELASSLKHQEALYSNFQRQQHNIERKISELSGTEKRFNEQSEKMKKAINTRTPVEYIQITKTQNDKEVIEDVKKFNVEINGKKISIDPSSKTEKAQRALLNQEISFNLFGKVGIKEPLEESVLMKYRGFTIEAERTESKPVYDMTGKRTTQQFMSLSFSVTNENRDFSFTPDNLDYNLYSNKLTGGYEYPVSGLFTRIDNFLESLDKNLEEITTKKDADLKDLSELMNAPAKTFTGLPLLQALREDNQKIITEIQKTQTDKEYVSTFVPKSYSVSTQQNVELVEHREIKEVKAQEKPLLTPTVDPYHKILDTLNLTKENEANQQRTSLVELYKQGDFSEDTLSTMVKSYQSYCADKLGSEPKIMIEKLKKFDKPHIQEHYKELFEKTVNEKHQQANNILLKTKEKYEQTNISLVNLQNKRFSFFRKNIDPDSTREELAKKNEHYKKRIVNINSAIKNSIETIANNKIEKQHPELLKAFKDKSKENMQARANSLKKNKSTEIER